MKNLEVEERNTQEMYHQKIKYLNHKRRTERKIQGQ